MYWMGVALLLFGIHIVLKMQHLAKGQLLIATFLEDKHKELAEAPIGAVRDTLPYGWFDDGWPVPKVDEEERAPLVNPKLSDTADDFAAHSWVAEYGSLSSATERKDFLRRLKGAEIRFPAEFLDLIFGDESVAVRAWAAGHLPTEFTEYIDIDKSKQIRDYEPALLADTEPVVRAALWSNPDCKRLPFSRWGFVLKPKDNWREAFGEMTQLERLGLMRNPHLADYYLIALLEASPEELKITRKEHVAVLRAGGLNPGVIGSSRRLGRKFWVVQGDVNPPVKEYATMWDLCLEKWLDEPLVPLTFFKYIQTTPEKKIDAYTQLLRKGDDKKFGWLRAEVIRSCDPFEDKKVLKAAWDDPNEDCRQVARERVGGYTKVVGVQISNPRV